MANDYRISARTFKVVWKAMADSVGYFEDKIKFRGRKFANEAYVNAAVWHFAELPIEDQERLLVEHVARMETLLEVGDEANRPSTVPIPPPNLQATVSPLCDLKTGKRVTNGHKRKTS